MVRQSGNQESAALKAAKSQTAGGGAITIVITENAETKVSEVKFKMYNTTKNLNLIKDWCSLYGSTIRIYEGDFSESFRDMITTSEPERSVGADGEFEVEWNGGPSL